LNNEKELGIQKIYKDKYLEEEVLNGDKIGIHTYSGTQQSAFYELWGETQIYRLMIMQPSTNLFMSRYLGDNHLFLFLIEDDLQMRGGTLSLDNPIKEEFDKIFVNLSTKSRDELAKFWEENVKEHYYNKLGKKKGIS
jgi:hypothetical protein